MNHKQRDDGWVLYRMSRHSPTLRVEEKYYTRYEKWRQCITGAIVLFLFPSIPIDGKWWHGDFSTRLTFSIYTGFLIIIFIYSLGASVSEATMKKKSILSEDEIEFRNSWGHYCDWAMAPENFVDPLIGPKLFLALFFCMAFFGYGLYEGMNMWSGGHPYLDNHIPIGPLFPVLVIAVSVFGIVVSVIKLIALSIYNR